MSIFLATLLPLVKVFQSHPLQFLHIFYACGRGYNPPIMPQEEEERVSGVENEPVPGTAAPPTAQRQVFRAAGTVAVAFVVGRLLGLVREIVISAYFGVDSLEANAYALANPLPELIFNVIAGGALASAFIPTFAAFFAREDEEGGWRLFSAVINLVLIAISVLVIAAAIWAEPLLVYLYIDPEQTRQFPELVPLTVRMLRVMLVATLIFGVSGVLMAALNARQRFLVPALAASIYNIGIIVGTVAWAPSVMGLAYGVVIGASGHLLIQLPVLWRAGGRYQLSAGWRAAGVRRVMILMAPRVIGLSFSQLNRFIMPILTRSLVIGSLPALQKGLQVTLMPYTILGQAVGTAAFPTLSALAAEEDWVGMRRLLGNTFRLILFLGLPITAGLMLLRRPLVVVLFERGAFDAADTELVAWGLLFYPLALIALAVLEIVSRAFYALEDTVTPVIASMLQLPLMAVSGGVLAYLVFPRLGWLPLGGLALGFSLSNWLEVVLLLLLLQQRIGPIVGRDLLVGTWRIGGATAVMSGCVWGFMHLGPPSPLWQLLGGGVLGAAVYFGAAALLQVEEMARLWRMARRR